MGEIMSEKRFEVVLNEFDEVEYIMDKEMMEDRNFADFIDFANRLAQNNSEQQATIIALKEDKKILDAIKKRYNCLNCVKSIENYCLKHYKNISKDEICEDYKFWK